MGKKEKFVCICYLLMSLYTIMPNYQWNGNYSSQFTYGLRQDVFRCYKEAKSEPRIRHMKRMKKLRDNIHPELNHFSHTNIRNIASRVEKDNIAMETEFNNITVKSYNDKNDVTENSQGDDDEQRDNDSVIIKNNIPYLSKTTVHSSETDTFLEELKGLFMHNITTVNKNNNLEFK